MWNNAEHLEAYLAVPAMGAVLHPLNIRLSPEQIAYIANHAEDRVLIADGKLVPLLSQVLPEMKTVEHLLVTSPGDLSALSDTSAQVHSYEEVLARQPVEYCWIAGNERAAAAMCYTSGTTGNPKAVVYSHRSIWLHSMQACMGQGFGVAERDRVLAVVPMFHALAWGLPYASLMTGADLLMPDEFLHANRLAAFIAAERPSIAGGVPAVWTTLLDELEANPADVSSLREVFIGGSACPPNLIRSYQERHGITAIQSWGMTETSPIGSVAREPHEAGEATAWARRLSQGRFPSAVEARLVGIDGRPLPHDGESIGELQVRGPWVTGTYYGAGDTEQFQDGWLRTGDVGAISSDGFLTLTDRTKDVIKSGGEWISSVELENALMEHPAVAEAVVVGVPDRRWGERPLAVVVLRAGTSADFAELRSFLATRFAKWQLPEWWTYLQQIPKTSVGKFDKKTLRRLHADGSITASMAT